MPRIERVANGRSEAVEPDTEEHIKVKHIEAKRIEAVRIMAVHIEAVCIEVDHIEVIFVEVDHNLVVNILKEDILVIGKLELMDTIQEDIEVVAEVGILAAEEVVSIVVREGISLVDNYYLVAF